MTYCFLSFADFTLGVSRVSGLVALKSVRKVARAGALAHSSHLQLMITFCHGVVKQPCARVVTGVGPGAGTGP